MITRAIGHMRHRITLEAPDRTPDAAGGAIETWGTIAVFWGAIETASGTETYTQDRMTGRLTHVITVRERNDIQPGLRLRHGARIFEIRAVLPAAHVTHRMRILCEERDL